MKSMTNNSLAARLGAVCYGLWGVLHLLAAAGVFRLGSTQSAGEVQARLLQGGWNLVVLAVLSIVIAAALNWKNSWFGYWLNLSVVSASDIGFIVLLLVPGYSRDFIGPILWLLGLAFSTVAILKAPRTR